MSDLTSDYSRRHQVKNTKGEKKGEEKKETK